MAPRYAAPEIITTTKRDAPGPWLTLNGNSHFHSIPLPAFQAQGWLDNGVNKRVSADPPFIDHIDAIIFRIEKYEEFTPY